MDLPLTLLLIFFHSYQDNMRTLLLSKAAFTDMLSDIIASGVTFEANETVDGKILINFTGGY